MDINEHLSHLALLIGQRKEANAKEARYWRQTDHPAAEFIAQWHDKEEILWEQAGKLLRKGLES